MLSKNNFVLLKAIFNANLHEAILNKDTETIEQILRTDYEMEMTETDVPFIKPDTVLDIEYVYTEHLREIANDDFSWAY